jgi:hypothetical protein
MTPRCTLSCTLSWAGRTATLLAVIVLVACAPETQAAVTLTGDDEVIIEAHEVIEDDLVVWATYVRIDGVIKGDLLALAEDVVVEGIVEGDLHAIGKTIYVNGSLNDDARLLAYAIAFGEKTRVADDAFVGGYSIEAQEESRVGGTLFAASRQLLLSGQVVEDVFARTGSLLLQGLTGGDVRAIVGGFEGVTHSQFFVDLALEIPELPEGLTLASSAAIGGDLDYRSPDPAVQEPGSQVAGAVRHEPWRDAAGAPIQLPSLDEDRETFGDRTDEALERLAVLLILALPLALFASPWLNDRSRSLRAEPLGLMGWGIGGVVFTGLLSMVLGIGFGILMVLGLSTGFAGLALTSIVAGTLSQGTIFALFFLSIVYLAPVLASVGIGHAIVERIGSRSAGDSDEPETAGSLLVPVVIGAVAYTALRAIPGVGPIVGIAAALAGLGALARWLQNVFSPDA